MENKNTEVIFKAKEVGSPERQTLIEDVYFSTPASLKEQFSEVEASLEGERACQ